MLFSILIAHYNNYNYFIECYKSIIAQSYQNFEAIIVDDCSTDGSYEKIRNLTQNDTRVKLVRNESNRGVGYTKKRCIDLASGEICGFVDPDDIITPNALQTSVSIHNEKNVATYSRFYLCDNQLNKLKLFPHSRVVKNGSEKFFNIFLEVNHFFTFKKDAYKKITSMNSELSSAEDQDLYLKLYEVGNFSFINEPLYLYRLHDKGVSQKKDNKGVLNNNWNQVILDTAKRRNIDKLYGKKIEDIENISQFLVKKQNNIITKILRKLS